MENHLRYPTAKALSARGLWILFMVLTAAPVMAQSLPMRDPEQAGMDPLRFVLADSVIEAAIAGGQTPGAVLLVVRDRHIVYRKAYGWKQQVPDPRPMTPETIFDLASLTKPVATAAAAMQLVEKGVLRMSDPVSRYLPEFRRFGNLDVPLRQRPQVRHLMTHTAGLPSYASVERLKRRYGAAAGDSLMGYLSTLPDRPAAGADYTYSCPSFITLQKVVEAAAEMTLDEYTREYIFSPLGMDDTFFVPLSKHEPTPLQPIPAVQMSRIAPTVYTPDTGVVAGVVHDPLAREVMAGVSGNAGLFSTADDLALFAAMLINMGEINGRRVLSPASVRVMTEPPSGLEHYGRTPGWDYSSSFASNQGDLMGPRTFGHTGYTGTSLVVDPDSRVAIILLTNRVYPDDTTSVVDLRAKVANIIAGSVLSAMNDDD